MPMTFVEAIKVCFNKYADFYGRATRSEYWWFFLALVLGSIVTSIVSNALCSLFGIATLLPILAAGSRRLHDTNRSGWWQLLSLVPFGVIVVIVFLAQPSVPETAEQK